MSNVDKKSNNSPEGTLKVVKQRNHDGGRIPPELKEYADRPLYVLIALWGLMKKEWIGHKQISSVFSITERRASFQLSYILRKKELIHCQTRKIRVEGVRRPCHQIKVEQVYVTESGGKPLMFSDPSPEYHHSKKAGVRQERGKQQYDC